MRIFTVLPLSISELLALAALRYLQTVEMGLLGGLDYAAYVDPTRGGTTDYIVRNQCMNRNWETGGVVDACIIKWDGYAQRRAESSGREAADNTKFELLFEPITCHG